MSSKPSAPKAKQRSDKTRPSSTSDTPAWALASSRTSSSSSKCTGVRAHKSMDVLHSFRRYLTKPHVRPWALSAPILVLLVCLPLLRPLRHPDPRDVSDDELARLATVQSLVEHRTLAIDNSAFIPTSHTLQKNSHIYSDQPPALAVMLTG